MSSKLALIVEALVVAGAYAHRARCLRQRGHPVPAWRQASFQLGLIALLAALISPLDRIAETRLF
ncbi:MAG TPA: cytochrome c oxidase assembly protein, partial [Solirubrobacterales bacterium]|nr:cytochrome c oxidase assembly protein [Solirubrobacterales bacterium]